MKFLSFLSPNFYCVGIMMFLAVAALVASIRYYQRHRSLRIFTYYIAFSLTESMVAYFSFVYPKFDFYQTFILRITYGSFAVFEFVICNFFILHYVGSPLRRRIIRINGLLFLLILTVLIMIHRIAVSIFILDSVFLVPPCLIYFYELFLTVNPKPLKDQPSFWVITAILFLNACSIPLQLTFDFLGRYAEAAYSLNDILYGILFIMLIRAYLCSPEIRTSDE